MKTLIYTFETPVTLTVASRLVDRGLVDAVIIQTPMTANDKIRFVLRRLRRYGLAKVVDEVLFKIVHTLFLRRGDEKLRQEHVRLDSAATMTALSARVPVHEVASINDEEGQALLRKLAPDLVVMASREMIRPSVLGLSRLGFVGCHPGILPEYRGVYASFWAMLNQDDDKVGLTVYLANAGIDTGPLVKERAIRPRFPIRHFRVESECLILDGAEDLCEAVERARQGTLTTYTKPGAASRFFSHVGLVDFVRAQWRRRRA